MAPLTAADIDFIDTPPQPPCTIEPVGDCGVKTTTSPTIYNPPLPADGPGAADFSNVVLASLVFGLPTFLAWKIGGGTKTIIFFIIIFFLPILIAYWAFKSNFSPRINDKVKLPGRPIDHYLTFKNPEDQAKYSARGAKISMETFHEMYFAGDVDIKGDMLDVLEYRHDWATFDFTVGIFKFLFFTFFPDVIFHSRSQDENQVRDTYDRGNDFYAWFLGPRMIYTSGIISDPDREETLEELQDNKLAVVMEKIELKEGERLLDIGCGWGTLARFASVNYGAKVTGVTLAREQVAWGNAGLRAAGVPEEQSQLLCCDYRDIPSDKKFNKITALEMAEHVGVRRMVTFWRQVSDHLEDNGILYVQVSGLRKAWQYEDFIWGLFMNKYIFPGADASTPLGPYVDQLESAGFEIKSVDTVGVHYSATLWRWYRNWLGNADKVKAKYGNKWYRIWEYFLASSTIASRQASATCFQIVCVKNLNCVHRIEGVKSQFGLLGALEASKAAGKNRLPDIKKA
ncbi:Sphingolipid C9-methyltransferase 1 [Pyricularia grisea]|uniref:sphingolipid C(9)-methyltransferase n=1 Tax=Pyricularia grisea TaxID=148305 RepID=A0A6P8BM80_PYRGI|nr:uncharacterized protein PgNI_00636 [Pyricularia grisea]KAI6360065.1 Sphingolipid C9-methyltransferase 1 [Pyricularia grisea]TLD17677.1 hypothetical protein PgNI_00636 [Pyricularia grisea]